MNLLNRDSIVENVEYLPKLIGRAKRAKNHEGPSWDVQEVGEFVCDSRGSGDNDAYMHTVQEVEELNKALLWACGVSGARCEEYAMFTGLKPRERLGMGSQERKAHYHDVAKERRHYRPMKAVVQRRPYCWSW